tara:strand:+ start:194 stop:625 length:432 start_codon:yes stop_codon:yes gene_type:complete
MEKAQLDQYESDVLRTIKGTIDTILKERADEDKQKFLESLKAAQDDLGLTNAEIDEALGRKKRLPTPTVVNLSNPSDITYSAGPKTPEWLQKMRNNSDYDRLDHARKSIPHLSGEALEKTKAFVAGKDEEAKAAAEKEAAKKK